MKSTYINLSSYSTTRGTEVFQNITVEQPTVVETYYNYLSRNDAMIEAEKLCKDYWRALTNLRKNDIMKTSGYNTQGHEVFLFFDSN